MDSRGHEQVEDDERRYRIAGESEEGLTVGYGDDGGLAGFYRDPMQKYAGRSELVEDVGCHVAGTKGASG